VKEKNELRKTSPLGLHPSIIMATFSQVISQTVESQLQLLQTRLIEAGLDETKVIEVFKNFNGTVIRAKKQESRTWKVPQDEKVHIVLNYGKSHAVFGRFDISPLKAVKDDHFNKLPWIKFSSRLAYGEGWNLLDPTKLSDLETILKKEGVKYIKLSRDKFDAKYREYKHKAIDFEESQSESEGLEESKSSDEGPSQVDAVPKDVSSEGVSSDSDSEGGPKGPAARSSSDPKGKSKASDAEEDQVTPKKKRVKKNRWGNPQESTTGIIFAKVLGEWTAVGTQNTEVDRKKVRGLDSIIRLTPEEEEQCRRKYLWKYLTEDMVKKVKDSKRARQLQKILDSDSEGDPKGPAARSRSDSGKSKEKDLPVYYLLGVPYDDDPDSSDIEVPVQFESQEMFDDLEEEDFESLEDQFNDYLEQYYDGDLKVEGSVSVIKKLKGPPKDEDPMVATVE